MKKWIKFGVILILLIGIIVVVGIQLQKPCTHIDENNDMRCDRCKAILPYNEYVFYDELETKVGENKVTVKGNMPQNCEVQVQEVERDAIDFLKIKRKYTNVKELVSCYDITIKSGEKEYEPSDYFQKCTVKIDQLNLEEEKQYVMLHDRGNDDFEFLSIEREENQISFVTSHFSVFMLVEVGGYNISFEGENYKVLDKNFNEITSTYTAPSDVEFEFYILPNTDYGIVSVTTDTTFDSGDNEFLYSVGYVEGKKCFITKVAQDININVDTALKPKITQEPATKKIKTGTTGTWTVEAENASTYLWQYRYGENDYWKSASALGSGYSSATFRSNAVTSDFANLDVRCLVGNDTFTLDERVQSDQFKIIGATNEVVYADYPIILEEKINEDTKKEVGKGKASYEVTALGNNLTFTWQYRYRENDYWKTVGNIGSVSSKVIDSSANHPVTKSTLTTTTMTPEISKYELRCLVGNSYHTNHDTVKSTVMCPIPAQNELARKVQYHKVAITKQPESQKVKLGDQATFKVETEGANQFKWQYKASPLDEFWTDVDSSIGTGYNTQTLTVDTSKMKVNEDLELEDSISGYWFKCVVYDSSLDVITQESEVVLLVVAQDEEEGTPILLSRANYGVITLEMSNGVKNGKELLVLNKETDKNRTIHLKYTGEILAPHVEISLQRRNEMSVSGLSTYTNIEKISDYFQITLSSNQADVTLKNSELDSTLEIYDVTNLNREHDLNFSLKDSVESGMYKITFDLLNYKNQKVATETFLIEVK